jgi:nucleosome binding factor SPN SPT16 subunit
MTVFKIQQNSNSLTKYEDILLPSSSSSCVYPEDNWLTLAPFAQLEPENVESCYTPIIMSGGGPYDLKPSASSNDNLLDYTNTIILEVGTRYKGYCSNIGRTYFVDPSPDQKEVYGVLTQVHLACLEAMKAGAKASAVM